MARGQQSLTRNLAGAGKGDRVRPREVSAEQERANYCNAFHQCFDCCQMKIKTQYSVIRSGNQTVICETCYNKEPQDHGIHTFNATDPSGTPADPSDTTSPQGTEAV